MTEFLNDSKNQSDDIHYEYRQIDVESTALDSTFAELFKKVEEELINTSETTVKPI